MAVVLIFVLVTGSIAAAVAASLTSWARRVPQIWNELLFQLTIFSEPLATIRSVREEIGNVTGESNVTVFIDMGHRLGEQPGGF